MSISQNFPEEGPTLNLNFAGSKVLDPRITFSRSSVGTYMDANGLIVTAAADEPRFDHRYVNGEIESLGLLVEEQRVNYEQNTEDPSQWTMVNMVPTGNSVTLPTGVASTSIEYKGETTDANNKLIRPLPYSASPTAGDTWTYSGFYKKGVTNGERYVHLTFQNGNGTEGIGRGFDFDTGTWNGSLGLNNVTVADSGYEEYPNGWYRIWLTCTFPSTSTHLQTFTRLHANSTSIPYDTSFSLWGAQLEKASFPTSYIPNDASSSQATRSPDSVSMEGTNFSDWYNQSEGTIYCSGNNTGITTTTSRFYYAIENTSSSSGNFIRKWIWNGNTGLLLNSFYTSNTTGQGSVISAEFSNTLTTDNKKTAVGYAKSDFASYYNGTSLNTDTSGNLPVGIDRLRIGTNLSGHISQLAYYPKRLTNTQLQNLTK